MTHNDYTAANFRASVAVYCGSVPKMKPGYMSLRNGNVDNNLQLYGNRWGAADTAALQSTLSLQVKRPYMWRGDDLQPEILDTEQKNESLHLKLNNPSNKNHREEEVDSAALETARLKDKLKRKMSESSSARGAPSELISSLNAPLKPAVPRSASQRLMNVTKPVPPIRRSPTLQSNAAESGTPRNRTENGDGRRAEDASYIESLQLVPLVGVVIPPITKSSAFPTEPPENGFIKSSTPGDEGKSSSSIDTDQTDTRAMNAMETNLELVSLKPIPSSAAKDPDAVPTPPIIFTISKSAQDKMRQKQQEIENIHNEKRRSQKQLWDRLQGVDSGGQCKDETWTVTSFSLSGVSTVPLVSEKRPGVQNISLNKWVSRPSLPSIPTVNQDANSDFRHSSAYSLPATFLDCSDWDSDSDNGGPGTGPMSHPEQGLLEALKWLNHKDWEQKEKGLISMRGLVSWHPEVLFSRLHDVSIAVTREVSNLRSKVSRHAIKTLGDLFKALRRNMDQEVEEITRVLLHKIGDSNDFIREESDKSLGVMVEYVSPSKVLSALIAGGISHRNSAVRKCAAKHLMAVVEQLAGDKLLSGPRESTDAFLRTLVKLMQDGQQDTRFYGRRMFSLVMTHPKFEQQMERLIPSHDLRELIVTVKQKEASDSVSDVPSARSQRPLQKSSVLASADARDQETPESDHRVSRPVEVESEPQESPVPRRQPVRVAEATEQVKELIKLLTAKEYQSKMDGVTLLLEHCKSNVKLVTSNITQIFDAFNPRLQDANKKVNQYALESAAVMVPLLKDSLHHVLVPMVTVITDNLNSKHSGIYTAAVRVLDTLISSIDNLWLLQPFAGRVRFISGRALNDVTERLSGLVTSVYPRKPQAVERHVLPVLWYFLSNITGNGVLPGRNGNFKDVVTKLTRSLHKVMGPSLEEYASAQSQHAVRMLADILGTK
ncbi:LOW QUALITY PROTEIN: TOG array regulator of axonemal microtubules protein 2 [Bufo gargarizans]|uniref:LOW QUALITY PROTEIN: TOG array regulator of axonemal microtubules protein 2 n=1 Tax=Bufo gargarizans TaxID=30331 RepID=UPI001CF13E27|nr:LOW QUALITY PROTEIN: TOG array regulator of axonemal microtubules protein 2 [Bufo gargarizans]